MKKHIFLTIILGLLLISCSGENSIPVKIELEKDQALSAKPFENILYVPMTVLWEKSSIDPQPIMTSFFLNDFAKVVRKDVQLLETENNYFDNADAFLEEVRSKPNTLVICGNILIEQKDKSIIKEFKENKKKKKAFVSIQDLKMQMEIVLIDTNSAKVFFKDTFKYKSTNIDPQQEKFNFDRLFSRNINRLVRNFMSRKRKEERLLLTK
jgi:hypothetical protein